MSQRRNKKKREKLRAAKQVSKVLDLESVDVTRESRIKKTNQEVMEHRFG